MNINSLLGKKTLALVRKGDYAHPGSSHGIDKVFRDHIPLNKSAKLIDVGSGLGGTAHYVQMQGYGNVAGIDMDSDNILYAQKKYPNVSFFKMDALDLASLQKNYYDVIYHFSSFYAFKNKDKILQSQRKIAKLGAQWVLFDFAITLKTRQYAMKGHQDSVMLIDIEKKLLKHGWKLHRQENVTDYFKNDYEILVKQIHYHKNEIIDMANIDWFNYVISFFSNILDKYKNGIMQGVILQAQAV